MLENAHIVHQILIDVVVNPDGHVKGFCKLDSLFLKSFRLKIKAVENCSNIVNLKTHQATAGAHRCSTPTQRAAPHISQKVTERMPMAM